MLGCFYCHRNIVHRITTCFYFILQTADIAAAPLTVTSERQAVVQFSMPFQSTGPAILMRKPPDASPDFAGRLLRLFAPMSSSVWLLSLISIMATATVLYVISYFSPVEWRKMAINNLASDRERESFTCMNSFWFIASCLTWQGELNYVSFCLSVVQAESLQQSLEQAARGINLDMNSDKAILTCFPLIRWYDSEICWLVHISQGKSWWCSG